MAARRERNPGTDRPGPIPPGATQRASDRDERPGGPPATPLDDRYGAGTPGGGTELGGLAGTNSGEGDPEDELEALQAEDGSGIHPPEADEEDAYAGFSGGAVGGTPAEDRATGGKTGGGLDPGGSRRGDSTIGADPDQR